MEREQLYFVKGYSGGDASKVKRLNIAVWIWLLSFNVCAAAIALSFSCADVPIALYLSGSVHHLTVLGEGVGSAAILSAESVTVVALVLARLIRGKLPPFAEALVVACLTSICAYGIDSEVLKLFFGVPTPGDVSRGAAHAFNFWKGSPHSSFPSGHMVLAGAFAAVFMRLYRVSVWPLLILLLLSSSLLVVGEWHFLSDVIAGSFLGVSAGLVAGELLKVHSAKTRPSNY